MARSGRRGGRLVRESALSGERRMPGQHVDKTALGRVLLGNPFNAVVYKLLDLAPSDAWGLESLRVRPAIVYTAATSFRGPRPTAELAATHKGYEQVTGVTELYQHLQAEGLPLVSDREVEVCTDEFVPLKLKRGFISRGRPDNTLRILAGFALPSGLRRERAHIMSRVRQSVPVPWESVVKVGRTYVEVASVRFRDPSLAPPEPRDVWAFGEAIKPLLESHVQVGSLQLIQTDSIDMTSRTT